MSKQPSTPYGEVTPMYKPRAKPARKGVYQIWDNVLGCFFFDYWNGKMWSAGGWATVEEAFKKRKLRTSSNPLIDGWRGLARKS